MIDYSYTECSSASIQALLRFHALYPEHRRAEVQKAVARGVEFILSQQRADGSWYGSWAVCFTYGTWFGLEALSTFQTSAMAGASEMRIRRAINAAVGFLLSHQNPDGGWGESFENCTRKEYISAPSQLVNTSWALLSLMAAGYANKDVIEKGIRLIMQRQEENGDWPQENISGVFNHNCTISYTSYRNVFPIWALGRWLKYRD
jgi:lanosterol synthase